MYSKNKKNKRCSKWLSVATIYYTFWILVACSDTKPPCSLLSRPYGSAPKHGRMTSTYGKFPRSGPSAPALCLCIEMLATQVFSSMDAIKFRKLPGISETSDTVLEDDLLHSPNCCNLKGRTQWPPCNIEESIHVRTYVHTSHYIPLHYIALHYITSHYITLHTIT